QCVAKYGFSRFEPAVMREFANLDVHENCEAGCVAAFSLVTPQELETLRRRGELNPGKVASEATISVEDADLIVEMFGRHREALLTPRLPARWNDVRFVTTDNANLRRLK